MIYEDLFGSSFYEFPQAKIVCNDFDNYMERLKNIDKTNIYIDKVKEILKDSEKGKRVTDEICCFAFRRRRLTVTLLNGKLNLMS